MAGVNQPIHWFLGGKGLGIQQGTSVWVGSPKSLRHISALELGIHVGDEWKTIVCQVGCEVIVQLVEELGLWDHHSLK